MRNALSKAVMAAGLLAVGGFTPAEAEAENDTNRKTVQVVSQQMPDVVRNGSTTHRNSVLWEILQASIKR